MADRNTALAPCPFCGGVNAYLRLEDLERWHEVFCPDCGVLGGPSGEHQAEAIAAWNRRAPASANNEPIAEVVSAQGDPEAFGQRELRMLQSIQRLPYGTKLYTEPQVQPVAAVASLPETLTNEQMYALIREHLGLEKYRVEGLIIDRWTGRFTQAGAYFDLINAAIEIAQGLQTPKSA